MANSPGGRGEEEGGDQVPGGACMQTIHLHRLFTTCMSLYIHSVRVWMRGEDGAKGWQKCKPNSRHTAASRLGRSPLGTGWFRELRQPANTGAENVEYCRYLRGMKGEIGRGEQKVSIDTSTSAHRACRCCTRSRRRSRSRRGEEACLGSGQKEPAWSGQRERGPVRRMFSYKKRHAWHEI